MGSVETLKAQSGIAKTPITIQQLVESLRPQVALALPRHLSADRMIRIALTCLRMNSKLAECTPQSLLASVMLASQLGLEPGVLGQAYLIPYKNKSTQKYVCSFIPGWQGLLDLMNRTGKATAWTGAVYQGDEFDWCLGDKPHIMHRPCGEEETLTHTYAIARVKGSEWPILEVWPVAKVWKHRDRFNKVGTDHYSFQHPQMYARKVALLQVLKYVPRSIELATALQLDEAAELGQQHYEIQDVKGVIAGTAEAPQLSEAPEKPAITSTGGGDWVCADCGATNGHLPSCKHRAEWEAAKNKTNGSTPSVPQESETAQASTSKATDKKVVQIQSTELKQGGKYLLVTVIDVDNNEWEFSSWDKKHHQYLITAVGKNCLLEFSKKDKGGRIYYNLEHILEIAGLQFVDDKPADQGVLAGDDWR